MATWRVIVGGIPEKAMADGIAMVLRGDDSPDFLTFVVEGEQEARTLARAEVIAEAVAAVTALDDGSIDGMRESEVIEYVLAALSRLGERE